MPTSGAKQGLSQKSGRLPVWARAVLLILLAAAVLALAWCRWVYVQVERYASLDEAQPADAIAVFGAAEYAGKPSPVYRSRLDHAKSLYARGVAPLIITLGGSGGDEHSEGEVGQSYLMGTGVPESAIIAETQSRSTSQSARRLAVIARANHLRRIVIVSDPIHMFRIHAICKADGIDVLTSPRPAVPTERKSQSGDTIFHEILTYTLWRLRLD